MQTIKTLTGKLSKNPLAASSMVVFAGAMTANVASYLYHLIVGRILGPVGYGELSSLISLLYIFGVPVTVMQTVLAKYFSTLKATGETGKAKDLFLRTAKYAILFLVAGAVVYVPASGLIASFLKIGDWREVALLYGVFVLTILPTLNAGVLQGYQLFVWLSAYTAGSILVKLALSIPFARWGVLPTVIAMLVSGVAAYSFSFVPLRFLLSAARRRFDLTKRAALSYSMPTFASLLGTTSLISTDIILAKHFLPAKEAGIYAAVSLLGKIIYYATSSVVTVAFPVIAARHAKNEPYGNVLGMAVLFVAVASLAMTGVYWLVPGLVSHYLFGPSFAATAPYLGMFGLFMALYSVTNLYVMVCLAVGKTGVWVIPVAGAVLQAGLLWVFNGSIHVMIVTDCAVAFAMVVAVVLYYRLQRSANAGQNE